MNITDVRIKLADTADDHLKAFCSITLDDCFVVRDLRIISTNDGFFVAMPSKKVSRQCISCPGKVDAAAKFCSSCGVKLPPSDVNDHRRTFADVAHPITQAGRQQMESIIIEAYKAERNLAAQPGYICWYDEYQ